MKAKKYAALISVFILLMSVVSVSADYDIGKNVYSFSYDSQASNPLKINMICLKPGVNLESTSNEELLNSIVFTDDFTVEAKGTFKSEFSILPGMPEGVYSIWLYTDQYITPSQPYDTFYYPSSSGLNTMLGEFNSDGADFEQLFNKYTAEDKLMLKQADGTDEYYLKNKADINTLFSKHSPFTSCDDIDAAFIDAVLTDKINKATDDTVEIVVNSLTEYTKNKTTASFSDNKEAILEAFLSQKSNFENCEEAVSNLKVITVLTLVNQTKENSKMVNIINDYADYIGIDYEAYVEAGSNFVNRYIIDKDFENVADIKKAVEAGIEAKTDDDSGSSNKGGGSGSSRGGGFSVQDNITNTITPNIQVVFNDMINISWAQEAVNALNNKGIVSGDGNNMFRPNDNVKREEFLKMLMLSLGLSEQNKNIIFEDVNPDAWYAPYVSSAYSLGITKGKSEKFFGVGDNITREEMATLITRAVEAASKNITEEVQYTKFTDESEISDYALESVKKLQKAGIVQGMDNNFFNPSEISTRAQAAVIIYRTVNNIEKGAAQ